MKLNNKFWLFAIVCMVFTGAVAGFLALLFWRNIDSAEQQLLIGLLRNQFWYFFSHAASYTNNPNTPGAMFFDPETMDAQINNPGWLRALEEYKRGLDYNPLGHTVVASDDFAGVVNEIDIATWTALSTFPQSGHGPRSISSMSNDPSLIRDEDTGTLSSGPGVSYVSHERGDRML